MEQKSFPCPQCNKPRLFTREKPNHILHLLLSLFLCGLWFPVWLIIALDADNKPFFCSACGYSDTAYYLLRLGLREKEARERRLEKSFTEKIQASPIYLWLASERGFRTVALVVGLIVAGVLVYLFVTALIK